jgi:hypothetical protein
VNKKLLIDVPLNTKALDSICVFNSTEDCMRTEFASGLMNAPFPLMIAPAGKRFRVALYIEDEPPTVPE